jgi:hypothetical protein
VSFQPAYAQVFKACVKGKADAQALLDAALAEAKEGKVSLETAWRELRPAFESETALSPELRAATA